MKILVLTGALLWGICGVLVADCSEVAQTQMDCSALSADEEEFASGLMPGNQMLFCQQFNGDQRAAAMQMVGEQNENGDQMNPDQAVRKVAKDNNIMPMAQQKQSPKKGGGCPARSKGS